MVSFMSAVANMGLIRLVIDEPVISGLSSGCEMMTRSDAKTNALDFEPSPAMRVHTFGQIPSALLKSMFCVIKFKHI